MSGGDRQSDQRRIGTGDPGDEPGAGAAGGGGAAGRRDISVLTSRERQRQYRRQGGRGGGRIGPRLSWQCASKLHKQRAVHPPSRRAAEPRCRPAARLRPVPRPTGSGRGSWLMDEEGDEWLDAYGGHAVSSTGHSPPRGSSGHRGAGAAPSVLFDRRPLTRIRERLAERLVELCPRPLDRVFFCNSGAEANENALHIARKHTGTPAHLLARRRLARPNCRGARRYRR